MGKAPSKDLDRVGDEYFVTTRVNNRVEASRDATHKRWMRENVNPIRVVTVIRGEMGTT